MTKKRKAENLGVGINLKGTENSKVNTFSASSLLPASSSSSSSSSSDSAPPSSAAFVSFFNSFSSSSSSSSSLNSSDFFHYSDSLPSLGSSSNFQDSSSFSLPCNSSDFSIPLFFDYLFGLSSSSSSSLSHPSFPGDSSSSSPSVGISKEETVKGHDQFIVQNAFNQASNSKYCYQASDIRIIQSECSDLQGSRVHQPIGDAGSLGKTLREIFTSLNNEPVFCVYNIGDNHWTTFATLVVGDIITVLYKDSFGDSNENLKNEIAKIINYKPEFISHKTKEQISGVDCGIFAIENMKSMARGLKDNILGYIEEFKKDSGVFCSSSRAEKLRKTEYAELYVVGMYNQTAYDKARSGQLEALKNNHYPEAIKIAERIRKNADFEGYDIISAPSNQIFQGLVKSIGIEIAVDYEIDPNSSNYPYMYRISVSKDILKDFASIVSKIQALFPGVKVLSKISATSSSMMICADSIGSITKIPKKAVTDYNTDLGFSELAEILYISNSPALQNKARQIIKSKFTQSLELYIKYVAQMKGSNFVEIINAYMFGEDVQIASEEISIPDKSFTGCPDKTLTGTEGLVTDYVS